MLDILVAGAHVRVRGVVCDILRRHPDIRIRGECGSGQEAVALAKALQPDIALVDLAMRDMHGLEAAKSIHSVAPDTRIVISTGHDIAALRSSVPDTELYEVVDKYRTAEVLVPTVMAIGSTRIRRQQPRLTDVERCAELHSYGILHTCPEQVYDDITVIAARRTGCSISVISLVDADRQWFKSRYGCHETETAREHSFCTHAIEDRNSLLIVPDARLDPRFSSNPLVTGPHSLHFYAGAPLVNSAGAALGTLCVIERKPRLFSAVEGDMLLRLAERVMTSLELGQNTLHLPA